MPCYYSARRQYEQEQHDGNVHLSSHKKKKKCSLSADKEMKAGEAHSNCLSSRKTSITYVLYAHLCERVCVCVCVRVCVFIHGHERIGHAQLVVAAVGVLPASGPPFLEQTYVSATSLPVGNNLCATFILITEP